jgi:hypothetical protein
VARAGTRWLGIERRCIVSWPSFSENELLSGRFCAIFPDDLPVALFQHPVFAQHRAASR